MLPVKILRILPTPAAVPGLRFVTGSSPHVSILTDAVRREAELVLGHDFDQPTLLEEALTHSSRAVDRLGSNERMEFLGDAVLDLIICERLYQLFPERDEGDLTEMKSAVVSRRTCSIIARGLGLDTLLLVGKGIVGRQTVPSSLAANVYESIIAALYLDGGLDVARAFVLRTMAGELDRLQAGEQVQNYKSLLQQHAQRRLDSLPHYDLLDEKGPDHSKCFEVAVRVDERRFGSAWGTSKKAAEQKAALVALLEFGVLDDEAFRVAVEVVDQSMPKPQVESRAVEEVA